MPCINQVSPELPTKIHLSDKHFPFKIQPCIQHPISGALNKANPALTTVRHGKHSAHHLLPDMFVCLVLNERDGKYSTIKMLCLYLNIEAELSWFKPTFPALRIHWRKNNAGSFGKESKEESPPWCRKFSVQSWCHYIRSRIWTHVILTVLLGKGVIMGICNAWSKWLLSRIKRGQFTWPFHSESLFKIWYDLLCFWSGSESRHWEQRKAIIVLFTELSEPVRISMIFIYKYNILQYFDCGPLVV